MSIREHGTRARYMKGPAEDGTPGRGCLCPLCALAAAEYRSLRARMIAYGRWESQVDATGTKRRIQALAWNGWPLRRLSVRFSDDREQARKILAGGRVAAATERSVRALYRELWDQVPPEVTATDRRAVTRARNYARERGFMPALAWDDEPGPHFIDDPQAVPVPGCIRGERREWGVITEEVVELGGRSGNPAMAGVNEHPEMIAQRLGANAKTVERTLQRAGQQPWRAATERAA